MRARPATRPSRKGLARRIDHRESSREARQARAVISDRRGAGGWKGVTLRTARHRDRPMQAHWTVETKSAIRAWAPCKAERSAIHAWGMPERTRYAGAPGQLTGRKMGALACFATARQGASIGLADRRKGTGVDRDQGVDRLNRQSHEHAPGGRPIDRPRPTGKEPRCVLRRKEFGGSSAPF